MPSYASDEDSVQCYHFNHDGRKLISSPTLQTQLTGSEVKVKTESKAKGGFERMRKPMRQHNNNNNNKMLIYYSPPKRESSKESAALGKFTAQDGAGGIPLMFTSCHTVTSTSSSSGTHAHYFLCDDTLAGGNSMKIKQFPHESAHNKVC